MLHHVEERFVHSRCEGNRRPIQPPQEPFRRVEPEIAEFVNQVRLEAAHGRQSENLRKLQRGAKDS